MRRDLGVVTVDGRRGTGKTRLAVTICRAYGASLVEVGPLFRLVAWQVSRSPSLSVARAVDKLLELLVSRQLVLGPLDHSSPGGIRITFRGHDLTKQLWNPKLDSLLTTISGSRKSITPIRHFVNLLSIWRPLVVVGREAGSTFFPNAGLKFVLTSHDEIREARKRAQLSRMNGNTRNPVDSPEPVLVTGKAEKSIEIDTTHLRPADVFTQAQAVIERELGWQRIGTRTNSEGKEMLSDAQEALLDFYRRFKLPIADSPRQLNSRRARNMASWIKEEATELIKARTIESQADALADAMYFVIGGFVELGLHAGTVFRFVHQANMKRKTTRGRVIRHPASGKILKPPDWRSPVEDIARLIIETPNKGES